MKNEVLLSIIIPVYNVEKYIEQCVYSFCNSNIQDFEIILIDDGSKDLSYEICKDISQRDDRIKLYHIANSGASVARNYGIEKATGNYIFFCDSDDYIDSKKLEEVVEILKHNDSDLFVFSKYNEGINSTLFIEDEISIRKGYTENLDEIYKYTYKIRLSAPWKKIFKRDIINKYNIKFEEKQLLHEDLKFLLIYLQYTNNAYIIKMNIYNHRYTENSLSKKNDAKMFFDSYSTYIKMEELLEHKKIKFDFINTAKIRYLEIIMGIIARMKRCGYKNRYIISEIKKSKIDYIFKNIKINKIKELIQLVIFKFRWFDIYMLIYNTKKREKKNDKEVE